MQEEKFDLFGTATLRTGLGMDVHAFAEGRKLILGGVDIPYTRGLAGHSDANLQHLPPFTE